MEKKKIYITKGKNESNGEPIKVSGKDNGNGDIIYSSSGSSVADVTSLELTNRYDGYVHAFWTNKSEYVGISSFFLRILRQNNTVYLEKHYPYSVGAEYWTEDIYIPTGESFQIRLHGYKVLPNNGWEYGSGWGYSNWENTKTLPTPSAPYYDGNNTITSSSTAPRVAFEYQPTNTASSLPYSLDDRQYFYDVCLNQSETLNWKYRESSTVVNNNLVILKRWTKPIVTVRCYFSSSANGNSSALTNLIISIINQLNTIIASSGTQLQMIYSGTSDIDVTFGTRNELFSNGFESYQNGSWETAYYSTGEIFKGYVQLATNGWNCTTERTAYEEMIQVLGAGNDSDKYVNSVYFEHPYMTKPNTYSTRDSNVLRMLYNHSLPLGASPQAIGNLINCKAIVGDFPSNSTATFNKSSHLLKSNTQYMIRAWAVALGNNNPNGVDYFSEKTSWVYFTTPEVPEFNWTYVGKDTNGNLISGSRKQAIGYYVGATEWTNLQNNINAVLAGKGMNQYSVFPWYNGDGSFTMAGSGGVFYYYHFNQVCNAIRELSPPIAPPSNKSSGATINASDLNLLMDSLNSVS